MADGESTARETRPRPQYGEYATPQDQADAIATSLPPVPPVLLPSDRPSSVAPVRAPATGTTGPAAQAPDPATRMPGPTGRDSTSPGAAHGVKAPREAGAQGRRFDLVVTVGLLVYGFLNVVSGLFQYADLGAYLDELYGMFGVGDYVETGMERAIGIAIVAANVISFALVAWFSVRTLRAHKIAFWIPIVGGVVATVASAIFLQILLAGDPALASYLGGLLTN